MALDPHSCSNERRPSQTPEGLLASSHLHAARERGCYSANWHAIPQTLIMMQKGVDVAASRSTSVDKALEICEALSGQATGVILTIESIT